MQDKAKKDMSLLVAFFFTPPSPRYRGTISDMNSWDRVVRLVCQAGENETIFYAQTEALNTPKDDEDD